MLLTMSAADVVDDVDAPAGSFAEWVLVAVAGPEPTTADDWAQDEVAAALRLSTGSARNRVRLARALTEDSPALTALPDDGEVPFRHALAAVELCAGLPRDAVARVQARVLPEAPAQSIAEFRRSLRRAVLATPRSRRRRRRSTRSPTTSAFASTRWPTGWPS